MKRSSTTTCEFTPIYFPPRNWNASSYANQGYTKGPFKSEKRGVGSKLGIFVV